MSNQLSSFMAGAQLKIYVNGKSVAFAQSLSFQESMEVVPVGGLGAYSYHALEPLRYSASGSLTITRWSNALTQEIQATYGKTGQVVPNPISGAPISTTQDGNSLLDGVMFNPVALLAAPTFDIEVYIRKPSAGGAAGADLTHVYTLQHCRMSGYSFGFTPSTLLQEGVTFICTEVNDLSAEKATITTTSN
jgi:hypothetical protein